MIANQSVHAHVKENMTCMMENESDATDAHVKEKENATYAYMTENATDATDAHVKENGTDAHVKEIGTVHQMKKHECQNQAHAQQEASHPW